MTCMAQQKDKKSLYLPKWLIEKLDSEGEILDGPGVIAGTAILAFLKSSPEAKAQMLRHYREAEISKAYGLAEKDTATPPDPTITVGGVTIRTDSKSEGYQRGRNIARKALAKGRAKKAAKKAANEQK